MSMDYSGRAGIYNDRHSANDVAAAIDHPGSFDCKGADCPFAGQIYFTNPF